MKEKERKHIVDILFVIALFGIFVISAIALISIGAQIYSKNMTNMNGNFNSRTAVAYVVEKVRQSDSENTLSLDHFEDIPAISIKNTVNSIDYITYIYQYGAELKELTVRADIPLSPSAGQTITEISDLQLISLNPNLIKCIISMPDNETYEFQISIHTGGGQYEF